MLDPELFNKTGWKDTRCKSTSEYGAKFCVKTTNPHVFEFEVWSNNCVGGRSSIGSLELNWCPSVLEEVHLRVRCHDTSSHHVSCGWRGCCLLTKLHKLHCFDCQNQRYAFGVEQKLLARGEDLILEDLDLELARSTTHWDDSVPRQDFWPIHPDRREFGRPWSCWRILLRCP